MKTLENITNAPAPDADYPNSRIKDESNPGVGNGVPVNEAVYGDMVQFFQKLLIDANIVANDNFDNVSNGYQTIEAFDFRLKPPSIWEQFLNPGISETLYKLTKTNSVIISLEILAIIAIGVTIATLPAAYRPIRDYSFSYSNNYTVVIQTNGVLRAGFNGIQPDSDAASVFLEYPLD